VWGTWCAECRVEHEELLAISRQRVVPIIGIDWSVDHGPGERKRPNNGWKDSAILTAKSPLTRRAARPSTSEFTPRGNLLIDRQGNVIFKHNTLPGDREQLLVLHAALGAPGAPTFHDINLPFKCGIA